MSWSKTFVDVVGPGGIRFAFDDLVTYPAPGLSFPSIQMSVGSSTIWMCLPLFLFGHLRFAKRVQNPASDVAETLEPPR